MAVQTGAIIILARDLAIDSYQRSVKPFGFALWQHESWCPFERQLPWFDVGLLWRRVLVLFFWDLFHRSGGAAAQIGEANPQSSSILTRWDVLVIELEHGGTGSCFLVEDVDVGLPLCMFHAVLLGVQQTKRKAE